MKKLANDALIYSIGLLIAFIALEFGFYGGSSMGEYFVYFGFLVLLISALVYYFRFYKELKTNSAVPEKVSKNALYCSIYMLISAVCVVIGYYMPGAADGLRFKTFLWNFGVIMAVLSCAAVFLANYLPLKKLA